MCALILGGVQWYMGLMRKSVLLTRKALHKNIRDEKTLMGCGQAQVRNEYSATDVPTFVSAMYAFLLLVSIKAFKKDRNNKNRNLLLPRPKWYPAKKEQRFTTGDLINHLRTEI